MIRAKTPKAIVIILALFILTISVNAEVPQKINYQGRLTDSGGEPITGSVSINFKIYNDSESGDSLWSSGSQLIQVSDGLFTYELGSSEPLPYNIFHENELWLSISVGSDSEMPRRQLATVPYAMNAVFADSARSAGAWVDDGSVVRLATSSDRVGIGTSSPNERLVVGKDIGNYGQKFIVSGSYYLDDVCGYKLGYNADNHSTIEWNGDGADFAIHTKRSGNSFNNVFTVNEDKVGIKQAYPSENLVVGDDLGAFYGDRICIGDNTAGAQTGLVLGEDNGNRGWLLWDISDKYLTLGTRANSTNYNNTIVLKDGKVGFGINPDSNKTIHIEDTVNLIGTSGTNFGVYADVHNEGVGFLHAAGYFKATGPYAHGIYVVAGESDGSFGVAGDFTSLRGDGIRARGTQYAGNFNGDVDISGNLSKSSGSFRIDHPLDPENKYLQHSFVESPDMMNIYNGNVITDNNGYAVVTMPDYFEALNMDFRYQLTVIGEFAQAIIGKKIKNKKFTIRTDKPNIEVSWMVTGIRKDRWAEEHRIQVEVDKRPDEQGYYISPELFGYGEEKGVDYKFNRKVNNDQNSE